MSGAEVFRCESNSGRHFALKRWPHRTGRQRVGEVHEVQSTARQNGCDVVPFLFASRAGGETCLADDGMWELSDWMPGAPLARDASSQLIRQGAAAIGSFHQAVRGLGCQVARPHAVQQRLRRLSELDQLLPQVYRCETNVAYAPELRETISETCALLFPLWNDVSKRIRNSLEELPPRFPVQYVLRDVHRGHVLFADNRVRGIIDFDAVRVDTPLTDLSRWGGSFLLDRSDHDEVWKAVLAGHTENYPFQQGIEADCLRIIGRLHKSATWISLANWAVWIRLECRTFAAGTAVVQDRINALRRLAQEGL